MTLTFVTTASNSGKLAFSLLFFILYAVILRGTYNPRLYLDMSINCSFTKTHEVINDRLDLIGKLAVEETTIALKQQSSLQKVTASLCHSYKYISSTF